MQARANLVDKELKRLEWKIVYHNSPTRGSDDRDRRLKRRLGSNMCRDQNTRTIERVRKTPAYKRERVTGSLSSDKGIHQRQESRSHSSENRQHDNGKSNHEDGINQIKQPIQSNSRSVEILSGQPDNVRTAEHLPGALNITADKESRVFNDSSNWKLNENVFQMIMSQFGKAELDLFADRTNHQLLKYQLETRSNSSDNGRILSEVEQHSRVCFPANLPNRQMSHNWVMFWFWFKLMILCLYHNNPWMILKIFTRDWVTEPLIHMFLICL